MNLFERMSRIPPEVLEESEDIAMPRREYRPPLRDDEPAPGGGRKRRDQDLSFMEDDEE